jgi:hypothetical protein
VRADFGDSVTINGAAPASNMLQCRTTAIFLCLQGNFLLQVKAQKKNDLKVWRVF